MHLPKYIHDPWHNSWSLRPLSSLHFISKDHRNPVPTEPASPPTEPARTLSLPRPRREPRRFRPFFPLRISRPGLHPPTATTTTTNHPFPFRPASSSDPRPAPRVRRAAISLIVHFSLFDIAHSFFLFFIPSLRFPRILGPDRFLKPAGGASLSLIFYNITFFFVHFAFPYAIAPH